MAEELKFPLKIELEADIENFVNKLNEALSRVKISIPVDIGRRRRAVEEEPAEEREGLFQVFTKGLTKLGKNITGGFMKGLKGIVASPLSIAVAAGQALVEIGKSILALGKRFSGSFRALLKLFEVTVGLLLKPIFDLFAFLLIPIIKRILRDLVIPINRTWSKFIRISNLPELIETGFNNLVDGIIEALKTAGATIFEGVKTAAEPLAPIFLGMGKAAVVFVELVAGLAEPISGLVRMFGEAFKAWGEVFERIANANIPFISDAFKGLSDVLETMGDKMIGIADNISSVGETISSSADNLSSKLEDAQKDIEEMTSSISETSESVVTSATDIEDKWSDTKEIITRVHDKYILSIDEVFGGIAEKIKGLGAADGAITKITDSLETYATYIHKKITTATAGTIGGEPIAALQGGGLINVAGLYYLHPGERVLPRGESVVDIGGVTVVVEGGIGDVSESKLEEWAEKIAEIVAQKVKEKTTIVREFRL
ncbi:hypothetical protein JDFR1000234_59 [uncultured archaeal virus]|uniref:Uncharacterized protein n=1 Tax=uncultured archaeal virus TaxID=1960247 RepID=A0A1S5Y352_9VIRU|nr:hypothetical protein JDFR1000234_59 [uncultured archaeal virus]